MQTDPVGYLDSINAYSYVRNSPLTWLDPYGLYAMVSSDDNGNVAIVIPINYEGPGVTSEVKERFRKGIEDTWSGTHGNYNVTVVIIESQNPLANRITVNQGAGRSDMCTWHADDSGWVAAHEAGHLMGLEDQYYKTPINYGKPIEGWKGNIMAEYNGVVWDINIKNILEKTMDGRVFYWSRERGYEPSNTDKCKK